MGRGDNTVGSKPKRQWPLRQYGKRSVNEKSCLDVQVSHESVKGLTMPAVRLLLAKEEEEQLKSVQNVFPHETTPSAFIFTGLELEEKLYVHCLTSVNI